MRCTECGYDGMENVAGGNCVKCGAKLQDMAMSDYYPVGGSQNPEAQLKQTVVQTGNYGYGSATPAQVSDLKKTVIQGMSGMPSDDLKATIAQGNENQWNGAATVVQVDKDELEDEEIVVPHQHFTPVSVDGKLECPNCHYPLSSDSLTSCPNCMADFTGLDDEEENEVVSESQASSQKDAKQEESKKELSVESGTINIGGGHSAEKGDDESLMIECEQCKKQISAEFKYCPYCSAEVVQRTVMFRKKRRNHQKPEPESQPEQQQEEAIVPQNLGFHLSMIPDDDEDVEAIINHYEGNNVILNRANTDPQNPTITSKQQAEVIFEDGKWFIENRSQYGSTFIAVNRRFQLMPGDVVMLGDRRFIFGIEDSK